MSKCLRYGTTQRKRWKKQHKCDHLKIENSLVAWPKTQAGPNRTLKMPFIYSKFSTNHHVGTWRNGSAFDSRSNGWVFKSPCPQLNLLVNETKTYDVSNFTLFLPYILVSVLNWIFRWTKQNRRCLKLHIILTLNAIIFMKTDSIFGNGVLRK